MKRAQEVQLGCNRIPQYTACPIDANALLTCGA